jgi:hypothetical protein
MKLEQDSPQDKKPGLIHAFAASAVIVFLLVVVIGHFSSRLYTAGGDLGWHYGLVDYIAQRGTLPGPTDPYLRAMFGYPPASHAIAASIGWLLGSSLEAIFVTGAIFTFGIYVIVGQLMQRGAEKEFFGAAVVLIALILGTRVTRQLSGNEIVQNFFYAQLAGDFAMLLAFALLTAWTPKVRVFWLLSAVAAVEVVGTFYVLSSVRLALGLVLFQIPLFWSSHDWRLRMKVALVLLLPVAALLHPFFATMVQASNHDGAISVKLYPTFVSITLLLAISLPAWFFARHRYDKENGRFALTCLSLGVALAALAQIAAFFALGLGSLYAIKKHAFLVGTLLMVITARWAIRLAPLKAIVDWLQGGRILSGTVPAFAFAAICMFAVFPWRSSPAAPFLRYDIEARAVMKAGTPDLQGSTLSVNRDFPLGLNFATSIAVMKIDAWGPLGRELFRVFGIAGSDQNSSSPASRFVLVRAADVAGKHADCEVGPQPVSVKLLRSTCFFDMLAAKEWDER